MYIPHQPILDDIGAIPFQTLPPTPPSSPSRPSGLLEASSLASTRSVSWNRNNIRPLGTFDRQNSGSFCKVLRFDQCNPSSKNRRRVRANPASQGRVYTAQRWLHQGGGATGCMCWPCCSRCLHQPAPSSELLLSVHAGGREACV